MRKSFMLVLCAVFIQDIAAQDSIKTTTLHEVVVSATRSQQPIIKTPRSVTVINRETIEKTVYNSVGELLSRQEGMYVVGSNQTPGTNQSLFMRGANSNQVVVMIDGARITDPSTPNAAVDLAELSLTDVEQIEIIRGSHSTLYGGSAIGGVVNIITKKGQRPGVHGSANTIGGVYDGGGTILSENIGVNYSIKNGFYVNGSLLHQNTTGLNASMAKGIYEEGDRDGFRKTDAYLKAGFKNLKWDVFASYKKVHQHAEVDNGAGSDDDNAFVDFDRHRFDYAGAYQVNDNWKISATGSVSKSTRFNMNDSSKINSDGDFDGTVVKGMYRGKTFVNEVQLNYHRDKIKGVAGVGQYLEDMSFNTYYFSNAFGPYEFVVNYDTLDTSASTNYVFAQIGADVGNFSVTLGSRYSHHSRFGSNWTTEINPSYRFNDLLLYGSLSTGFNAASLYQLYDPSQDFGSYTTRGNKNLKPEESVSIEFGVKKEFASGSYVTVSAFQTTTKNSIEYVYLWNKNTSIADLSYLDYLGDTYLNMAKQTVKGLEVSGHLNIGKFYANANVTMLDGELTFHPNEIDTIHTGGNHVQLFNYGSFVTSEIKTDKLVRRPQFTSNAEVGFKPNEEVTLTTAYRYAGSRFDSAYDPTLGPFGALGQISITSYHLFDVGASFQLTKALLFGFKVENIFNERYQEIGGFQTRGRTGYLNLVIKW